MSTITVSDDTQNTQILPKIPWLFVVFSATLLIAISALLYALHVPKFPRGSFFVLTGISLLVAGMLQLYEKSKFDIRSDAIIVSADCDANNNACEVVFQFTPDNVNTIQGAMTLHDKSKYVPGDMFSIRTSSANHLAIKRDQFTYRDRFLWPLLGTGIFLVILAAIDWINILLYRQTNTWNNNVPQDYLPHTQSIPSAPQ